MLELLQGLHKEWPASVWYVSPGLHSNILLTLKSDFVRQHCWLVNFEGKSDSFLPIDMAQEHNIKDIKIYDFVSRSGDCLILSHVGDIQV